MVVHNTKIIIGLTGNIATGKSVVRKMLQRLGAYGIDADKLSHKAIGINSPGYQEVINEFGNNILDFEMEIDRKKLGKIVFSDPIKLKKLETIIHPIVRKATKYLIDKVDNEVIVIEAIKLLESPIKDLIDNIWVTTSTFENQVKRLAEKRSIPEDQAIEIMNAQSIQSEKIKFADSIIKNDGSIEDIWNQVSTLWNDLIINEEKKHSLDESYENEMANPEESILKKSEYTIIRANPSHASEIIKFIESFEKFNKSEQKINHNLFFGDQAFFLIVLENTIFGVVSLQIENLIAKVEKIWLKNSIKNSNIIIDLFNKIEIASQDLQAEVILLLLESDILKSVNILKDNEYILQDAKELPSKSWRGAVEGSINLDSEILYKRLIKNKLMSQI